MKIKTHNSEYEFRVKLVYGCPYDGHKLFICDTDNLY